jgi:hypothetical protein
MAGIPHRSNVGRHGGVVATLAALTQIETKTPRHAEMNCDEGARSAVGEEHCALRLYVGASPGATVRGGCSSGS